VRPLHLLPIFVLLTIAGLMAAGAFLCEGSLRVVRRTDARVAVNAEVIAGDGAMLKATFVPAVSAADCVVVLHGIADSRASALGFAPLFLDSGYSVLVPDSRAHGLSGGEIVKRMTCCGGSAGSKNAVADECLV
jgi:hypothetical protein